MHILSFLVLISLGACVPPEPVEERLVGPGFDPETGSFIAEGDQFLVSIKHMQVRNLPGPGGRFGDHMGLVTDATDSAPEGLLGSALRNVGRLNWWTLTVWRSEKDLLDFVMSPPHADALRDFQDVTVGGEFRSFEVAADALPLAWEDALERLLEAPDTVSGTSDWYADNRSAK